MPPEAGIYVIDDEPDVCRAIQLALVVEGLSARTFPSARAFLAELHDLPPGVIVCDVCMSDMDGIELVQHLAGRCRRDPVIVISGHADVPLAVRALRSGAVDFIEKPFDISEMISSITAAKVAKEAALSSSARLATLSTRERQVLEHLVEGDTNKHIGLCLGISPRTVEIHRANLMNKLGARSLSSLVRIGLDAGFARETL